MGNNSDGKSPGPSRRDMLKLAGAASTLAGGLAPAEAAPAVKSTLRREALENLSAAEADTLEAFCARLIPTEEPSRAGGEGPGPAPGAAAPGPGR